MSSEDLVAWTTEAVIEAFGLEPAAALTLARTAAVANRSTAVIRTGEVVALCRVTLQLPWVATWWTSEQGRRAFGQLPTVPDVAWTALNELCAVPAPDAFDPNWPDHKVFWAVDVPEGGRPGVEFVVGDGEGGRYVMRVVERDERVGVELVRSLGTPLDSFWYQAVLEAEGIVSRNP